LGVVYVSYNHIKTRECFMYCINIREKLSKYVPIQNIGALVFRVVYIYIM
jgi:hypothetical protein